MASLAPGAAPPGDGVEEKLVVAIRPRPLSGSTPDAGLRLTPGAVEVAGEGALLFDRVFAAEADNGVVYDDVAAPVVQAVLRGVSGAVLAYGQTGSGKTRTMRGVADDPGLVPRAVRAIFEHVSAQAGVREFKVLLSYFEIYNETLKHLLCPTAKLDVAEGPGGVDLRGSRPIEVADLAAALRLLAEGDACRKTAATAMNAQSSRSHCIVRIAVESKKANAGVEGRGLVAVLSLVDLAGSESADKTGHTSGMRALEGAKINTSLFALSRVIEALSKSDGSKPPFRDSKLTHLLKPALESGASSKTALICCVNPAAAHASETQSTLQFARKARCVVTRPVVREDLSERDLMRRLAEKNEALQAALAAAASEATATATAEIAAQRAEADAEKKRHAEAEAAAVAETAAAQAETAAARTETAAAKAKTAALRDRLARVNAANLVGQLGVQDAEAGDARAKRAGRRATLAATAAAAAPAVDGSEANNALLSALAARHGPTKAALAAEVAARATTETALMSAEAALTAAEAELDAALRRNEQLTAELSFAAMFSAAEIARARAAAAQDIALAAAKVAAATEVADAARAGEAAAMATAAAAAASADFMDADAPLPCDFDDDVRDKENADCAVQQGSKPVSGKRSRGGDGAAGGARSLRVRKGAAGSDGVDQHGCIGVCRVGQAGPFQLRPATEPGAAEPPAAAAKRSRNQAAASKPSAAKQPRITAKEPCKAVPPTTRNRCHCKCDSTGCGGHLCPVNKSTRRSRCGGEGPDHERCGGGLCPVNKSTRRSQCGSEGAGHEDCGGSMCPVNKSTQRYQCSGEGAGHEDCGGGMCPVHKGTQRYRCSGEGTGHEDCGGGMCPVNKSTRRNRCRSKGAGHKDCRGP